MEVSLISRLSVLTVTRKLRRRSRPIGCSAMEVAAPVCRLEVRAHLQRDPLVAYVGREAAELDRAVVCDRDVVDDPDPVAEAVGAAPLDRLPDRRQAERLAGVDGEVGVLALEVLEGVEVAGGRVARLGAGDVEVRRRRGRGSATASSAISIDLAWWRMAVSSGRTTIRPPAAAMPSSKPSCTAAMTSSRVSPPRCAARARNAPRRRPRRRRPDPRRTRGRPGSAPARVCITPTVWSKVSR